MKKGRWQQDSDPNLTPKSNLNLSLIDGNSMNLEFSSDTRTLQGLIGRHLIVTGCSGERTYKGVLVSADPVSRR